MQLMAIELYFNEDDTISCQFKSLEMKSGSLTWVAWSCHLVQTLAQEKIGKLNAKPSLAKEWGLVRFRGLL